jgi:hypothetical protein
MLSSASPNSVTLMDEIMPWCDRWFDPDAALVVNPPGSFAKEGRTRSLHLVTHSAWYAYGLLRRNEDDDISTANRIFKRLLTLQYDAPQTPFHGTWARFLESPTPGAGAKEWDDYDPNFRQFVGTAFSLALIDYRHAINPKLAENMQFAISLAVQGEPQYRVESFYSK